jgi:hypothetical protein
MAAAETQDPWRSARLTFRALEPEDEAFVHELESEPAGFIHSQTALKRPQARRDSKRHYDSLVDECLLAVAIRTADEAKTPVGVLNLTGMPNKGPSSPQRDRSRHSSCPSRQGLWI